VIVWTKIRSMTDNVRQGTRISVRMPRDLIVALTEKAKAEDRTPSAEVRRAVRRHVRAGAR